MTDAPRGALTLRGVTKTYGDVRAIDDVSLEVRPGEFLTLLGPSGSGKTTTLRVIVGFVDPDEGAVILDDRDLTAVPSYERDMGMVFQNYALFPHMTAAQNVAFPLEMRDLPRASIGRRVAEALELVHLGALGRRYPRQLSGGQQQRVALARAIVFAPRLLLMDEPLGALDKKLREALQLEIKRISRELRTTVVYVTHDQDEALVLSDRIAVYNHGRIEQLGEPETLYERPASLFAASFLGESNVFRGRLILETEGPVLVDGSRRIPISRTVGVGTGVRHGEAAAVVVRPERTRINPAGGSPPASANGVCYPGALQEIIYIGATRKYVVDLGNGRTAVARVQAGQQTELRPGSAVEVGWDVEHGVLVPDDPAVDVPDAGTPREPPG